MVSFASLTADDWALVDRIVDRAQAIFDRHPPHPGASFDRVTFEMDIAAVHAHTPLNFNAWLDADDFNFVHDWVGIQHHIDRTTGRLTGHFLPRFAVPASTGSA